MQTRAVLPVRLGLAALLAILLAVTLCHGLATRLNRSSPQRAIAMAPWYARALAWQSQTVFGDGRDPERRRNAADLARRALRRDPTSIVAVTTLGLKAQVERPANARPLFRYAQALSRRDVRSQLWLIEDAVARGDTGQALHHYDVALRTSSTAPALLYPVLATAIGDPAIRRGLMAVFQTRPAWEESFLTGVTINGPDFVGVATLLLDMRRAGMTVPPMAVANLVGSLAARGNVAQAWQMYALTHPRADRMRPRDYGFVGAGMPIPPFDWMLLDENGVSAIIAPDHGGSLDVQAPATTGGTVARQLQYLPPGRYRLQAHATGAMRTGPQPYWSITCTGGRSLVRLLLTVSREAPTASATDFTVPTDCPAQSLALVVQPVDDPEGVAFSVQDVDIAFLSGRP